MKIWKDTAQAMINALSNELAVNAISSEIAQRQDGKIDKRCALQHNDVQLNNVIRNRCTVEGASRNCLFFGKG
jgi:hypothetical protein